MGPASEYVTVLLEGGGDHLKVTVGNGPPNTEAPTEVAILLREIASALDNEDFLAAYYSELNSIEQE